MGSAKVQGQWWGARAQEWAALTEPGQRPFYEAVFDAVGVDSATSMLDVGCGAGLALRLAVKRGAVVAGLDAAPELVSIARERVPEGDIRVGELEELPFPDAVFSLVTSFNAVQYAADSVRAVREMARVARPGGSIVLLTWGAPEQCEMRAVLGAIGGLLPPPPAGAAGPFALSAAGALEGLCSDAGLRVITTGEVPTPYVYPDVVTAVRAQSASGPAVRAARHAGDAALARALTAVLAGFQRNGEVMLNNVFRFVIGAI